MYTARFTVQSNKVSQLEAKEGKLGRSKYSVHSIHHNKGSEGINKP